MNGRLQISPVFESLSDPDVLRNHIDQITKPGITPKLNGHFPTKNNLTNNQEPQKVSNKQYCIGIWLFNVKDGWGTIDGVYRDGFIDLVRCLGFFKKYRNDGSFHYIRERENIIESVEISHIRDEITALIRRSEHISLDFSGIQFEATAEIQKEKFFRNSPSLFNDSILGHLPNHDSPVLRDSACEMFFPFQNCIIRVTKDGVYPVEYKSLKGKSIWQDHITNRSINLVDDCNKSQYADFISNIAGGNPERIASFESAIGYLLHNHSNPTTARAVIAYDEQLAKRNEPQGGSGKGVFAQALSQLRSVAIIDGKKIKAENPFSYQQVNERTQVISFDDVKPDFDFLMLNSNLTTGWQIEHKHKPAFRFPQNENPKTYITSNAILKAEGTTAERRQFVLTFSPFYMNFVRQKIEPILHEHGCMFFSDDWDKAEWNRFFSYMFHCCQVYLREGLIFYEHDSIAQNKLIQLTSEDFFEWIKENPPSPGKELDIKESFLAFRDQYYGAETDFKQRTFTTWMKIFASTKTMTFSSRKSNGKIIGIFNTKSD